MRATPEAGSPAWPMRLFRPWLVATLGGLTIGASLLSFDSAGLANSYPESAPHAAVYDAPAFPLPARPDAPIEAADAAGRSPAAESASFFAPAEPIAAFADLDSAPGPASAH